ncbi:E3 ubiquitin-protein ligase HERC1 [Acrasis kona]|uniref:E3 ubiquitin-protein ligase HERC1 n=1 Tax=Acrasis kona TaxID=1008807 RepID=A0AAW2ZGF9_9EUKA
MSKTHQSTTRNSTFSDIFTVPSKAYIVLSPKTFVVANEGEIRGKKIVDVGCGMFHFMLLSSEGKLYGYGDNSYGAVGTGSNSDAVWDPSAVRGETDGRRIVSMAGGFHHSIVLDDTGTVFTYGWNYCNQLGTGDFVDRRKSVKIDYSGILSGKIITQISCGSLFSLLLSSAGEVYSFGDNKYGQLGYGDGVQNTTVAINSTGILYGKRIASIASGFGFSIIIDYDGVAYGFGYNLNWREIGINSRIEYASSPVAVYTEGALAGMKISQAACGFIASYFLSSNGDIFSSGSNQ